MLQSKHASSQTQKIKIKGKEKGKKDSLWHLYQISTERKLGQEADVVGKKGTQEIKWK